jgi:pimeloyl-ACP methyl ester carboxylesterase
MVATESIQKIGHPTLEVTKYGECPQVLFIHGCTETSAIWLPVMQELGNAGVESAAVDLRGHGGSEGHGSLQESGIEDYVADALAFLDCFEYEKTHEIG